VRALQVACYNRRRKAPKAEVAEADEHAVRQMGTDCTLALTRAEYALAHPAR
jgi:hypothetical protein